jgi:hypothetical protein
MNNCEFLNRRRMNRGKMVVGLQSHPLIIEAQHRRNVQRGRHGTLKLKKWRSKFAGKFFEHSSQSKSREAEAAGVEASLSHST